MVLLLSYRCCREATLTLCWRIRVRPTIAELSICPGWCKRSSARLRNGQHTICSDKAFSTQISACSSIEGKFGDPVEAARGQQVFGISAVQLDVDLLRAKLAIDSQG